MNTRNECKELRICDGREYDSGERVYSWNIEIIK